MVASKTRTVLLVLALLAAAGPLGAQEGIVRPRRLLLFFSAQPAARYSEVQTRLLYASLLARLASAEAPFRVIEWGAEAVPADDPARTEAALSEGCDAWAGVELTGSSAAPGYHLRSYDLVTRKQVADLAVARDTALRPRDLERRFWDEAAAPLAESFRALEVGTRVRFRGVPGTVLTGLPGGPLTLDDQGQAQAILANPSLYTLRAAHRLRDPVTLTFSVRDQPLEVELSQERAPRFFFDGGLATLSFPSADAGLFLTPNRAFLKLGLTTYAAGLFVAGGEGTSLFASRPLTELRLQAGSYLNPPDARFRFYGSAGALLRLVLSRDYFGVEPLAPLALQLALGAETRAWKTAAAFFEAAPTLYLTREAELLAASYPVDSKPFNTLRLQWGMVDFLHYRAGVRVRL